MKKDIDLLFSGCYIYYVRRSTTVVSTIDVPTTGVLFLINLRLKGVCAMTGISSDVIRGYNDTMILFLLLEKPSYGYEISKQIKSLSQEKYVIKDTTLYSAFTRM